MVEKEKTVASINDFLRKLLKLEPSDSLVNILNILVTLVKLCLFKSMSHKNVLSLDFSFLTKKHKIYIN